MLPDRAIWFRMLKKAIQRGPSEANWTRSLLGYVEEFDELRTKLRAFFSILLHTQLHIRKEIPDLKSRGLRRVGPVDCVEFDIRPVRCPNGPRIGLGRVSGAHEFTMAFDGILPVQYQDDYRTLRHKRRQTLKKGSLTMHSI